MEAFLLVFGFVVGIAVHYSTSPKRIYTVHIIEHDNIKKHNVFVTPYLEDARNWIRVNSDLLESDYQYFTIDNWKIGDTDYVRTYYDNIGIPIEKYKDNIKDNVIEWVNKELTEIGYNYQHKFSFGYTVFDLPTIVVDIPNDIINDNWCVTEADLEERFMKIFEYHEIMFATDDMLITVKSCEEIYVCD